MIINLVVAATDNNVIGKNNQLLWHLPNDMAFFKNTTWGMPVIMGRKTFESMGKPLKGRTNIIISRNHQLLGDQQGILLASGPEEALSFAAETDAKQCYVIGGGEIYNLFIHQAQRIYMTRVHTRLEGDAFFPEIDHTLWQLYDARNFDADPKHAYPYSFETWQLKKPD